MEPVFKKRKTLIISNWIPILFIGFCSFLFASCNNGEKIPDVSSIKVSLATQRLDVDLAKADTTKLPEELTTLYAKYPDFLNFYLDTLMGFNINGRYTDTNKGITNGLKTFLTFKDYKALFDTVIKHYPDTKDIDKDLTAGFQFLKYYFPKYQVPKVIYLVSGLNNWGAFTYESKILGIGLDMFLGNTYPFYRSVGLPEYLTTHLDRAYIPVAAFTAIYQDSHPFNTENKTLLDLMIQRGIQQYFLKKVLPRVPDSTRLGYTQKQLEWCNANEAIIYNFFIKEQLFYNRENQKIYRYVFDGPNSAGMPAQSPGNIGTWMGLQIVNGYMNQHPDMTLQQLLEKEIDAQAFLQESKYKPK